MAENRGYESCSDFGVGLGIESSLTRGISFEPNNSALVPCFVRRYDEVGMTGYCGRVSNGQELISGSVEFKTQEEVVFNQEI